MNIVSSTRSGRFIQKLFTVFSWVLLQNIVHQSAPTLWGFYFGAVWGITLYAVLIQFDRSSNE